jgi:hypothetical protein
MYIIDLMKSCTMMRVNIISNFLRDIHIEKTSEWIKDEHLKISRMVSPPSPQIDH